MKIGFVVNQVGTEQADFTTIQLALAATQSGHEAWLMGVGDFAYEPDGSLTAMARAASAKNYRSIDRYLDDVQKPEVEQHINVGEFDAIMLRNDPAEDASAKPWANSSGVAFGQLIAKAGVLVVNDPTCLANAQSKAYFQHFPEIVRPRTLISRDVGKIKDFVRDLGGRAILKPLQGSGGSGVFLVTSDESPNLRQIVEALTRDGYVVTQEYLPEAKNGDVRMFVMNGRPLELDGRVAAFRRQNKSSDIRSNMSVGGEAVAVEVTDEMRNLVDLVRPKLVADGMFLVGVDIVGNKLMEVNVFSPGGLGTCEKLYGVNFCPAVLEDIERKVKIRRQYSGDLSNRDVATL